jgi:hypothetical protein
VTRHPACDPSLQSIAVRQPGLCYDISLLCVNDDHGKYLTAKGSEVSTSRKVALYRCGTCFSSWGKQYRLATNWSDSDKRDTSRNQKSRNPWQRLRTEVTPGLLFQRVSKQTHDQLARLLRKGNCSKTRQSLSGFLGVVVCGVKRGLSKK